MKCKTSNCRNKSYVYKKNGKVISRYNLCTKCRRRRQKEKNILRYTFDYLKQNAKRRGKEFILTIEEFKDFCIKTDYLNLKGKNANSLTIDRIDNKKGYQIDNIQAVSLSYNSRKSYFEKDFFEKHGYIP